MDTQLPKVVEPLQESNRVLLLVSALLGSAEETESGKTNRKEG